MNTKKKVAVIGGGLAGLAAAYELGKFNYQVELYEKRDILGGKWSSWQDEDGDWLETGLHVFFGAYQEIFELMQELKIYDRIDWKEHVLTYTLDRGERFEFRTIKLPSPFHLLPAVFQNHYFNIREKLSLAKALGPILFGNKKYYQKQDQITYQEWHQKQGIADKMLKKMFLPMTLALKFLAPKDIAAKIVLDVSGTFLRKNTASRIGLLRGCPENHLIQPIAQAISKQGNQIQTGAKLQEIKLRANDTIDYLILEKSNGELQEIRADYYVLALPIHNLQKVMPSRWLTKDYFAGLQKMKGVPVITLHLWTDQQITDVDNILFSPDGHIPVYADLSNTTSEYHIEGKSRFQFVIAPAYDLMHLTDAEIIDLIWKGLQGIFPQTAPKAKIEKAKIIRVPSSVYWPEPNIDKLRVPQKSPISNLALAGGYTHQMFYDSMEGAVRSGNRAAFAIRSLSEKLDWQLKD